MSLSSLPAVLLAESDRVGNWGLLGWHLLEVAIYVTIGLALFAVAYLIVDKATPFDLGQELIEKKNTAIAIVLAGIFIGIAVILAAAMRG